MSRLEPGRCKTRAHRTHGLRIALNLQIATLTACSLLGCHSVGGLRSPFSKSAPSAVSNRPMDQVPGQPSAAQSAALSLRDNNTGVIAPPRRDVVQVAYTEPVAAPDAERTYEPTQAPIATLAACRVSGSCAPNGGTACGPSCGDNCGCGAAGANCLPGELAAVDIQEYLFDGGDLDPALVVRQDASIAGLNPTDTIAYYETYDGKLCVTPTNRVPIYAPRFGAVRQVTGAVLSEHAVSTQRILAPVAPGRFDDKNLASTVMQPVAPQGEETVSLIDAFRDRNLGVPIAQVIPPQRMSDAIVPFENLEFFLTGQMKANEIAVLGQFLENARTWVTPESLEVLIDGQEAAIVLDVKQAQDVHVYELPPGKCTLRICKAASHMVANSGDEISFTLRFDNIGTQPIDKVVILDSLSPRLEYIQESQQSSVAPAPEFSSEPNEVGSTVLRWEFKSALKPGEGGVLHFRCLVR